MGCRKGRRERSRKGVLLTAAQHMNDGGPGAGGEKDKEGKMRSDRSTREHIEVAETASRFQNLGDPCAFLIVTSRVIDQNVTSWHHSIALELLYRMI